MAETRERMKASKENATKAHQFAKDLFLGCNKSGASLTDAMRYKKKNFIFEFLVEAERKLPSDAAYEREQKRRRT